MLAALAWRNLWRNPRRTAITMAALSLGVAGIVGLAGYREAIYRVMIHDITTGLLGDLQVHAKGYQETPAIESVVPQPEVVEAVLAQSLPGATAERRVMGAALAGVKEQSAPVMVVGVGVSAETGRPEQSLHTVTTGRNLTATAAHEALLGQDLAKDLGVDVGDELVLVAQAADGSVANDRYSIVGLFRSPSAELDAAAVLLHLRDAQDFYGLGEGVHQLVVRLPESKEDVTAPLTAVRGALDLKTLEALSWGEMLPELKASITTKRKSQNTLSFIVLFIVALGVFNAMTMSTFERTREFGVLSALGTRPRRVLALILTEAVLQGAMSFVLGVGLAAAILYGVGTVDMSSFVQGDVLGARMPSVVKLGLELPAIVSAAWVAIGTMVAGSLLPAVRAARLHPVEAMRHT